MAELPASLEQLMPKQVLTALLEKIFNKVLSLDSNTHQSLEPLQGKNLTLLINEFGFPLTFHVSDGDISVIANKLTDDCLIACNLQTLQKLQQPQLLTSLIKSGELDIIGDVKIAQQFAALAEHLNIDWQSLLAERIGDVPTHQLHKLHSWFSRKLSFAQQQISEDASEFFIHEAKLVVSKTELDRFNQDVASLLQQVDTLITRFNSLNAN